MTNNITDKQVEALKKAIDLLDGQENLALALGLKYQAQISSWVCKRRPIPPKHCMPIEKLTNSAVTRYELRPDFFGSCPEEANKAA